MENRIEIRPGRTINIRTYSNSAIDDTIFLFHGLGGRGEQWHNQIEALKGKYNLIVPDLLGHGKSDKPKPKGNHNPYSFNELELDLQAIFKKYANAKNIIIAHSYGGALATSVTFDHQDQVSKLILLAPTPCAPSFKVPFIFRLPACLMELFRPALEKNFQQCAFEPFDDPQLLNTELIAGRANPMYMISGMVRGMQDIPKLDVTMLTVPSLIMLGNDDKLVPPAASRQFYTALPHHRFELIQQAAHLLMLEKPDEVNKLIVEFNT